MHVRAVLLIAVASGGLFYALGRYGQERLVTPDVQAFVREAFAQGKVPAEKPQPEVELAQTQRPPAGSPAPPSPPPVVDESALRYFATQGDTRRLEAEMARLRALYPEWKPPTDLTAPLATGDPELARMWGLFGEGKFSEVRAAIAQRSAADSSWQPPSDLVQQLDTAEAAQRLVNASNARQWEQVIRIGTETPALLTCANVDALWRVADAFVQTKRVDRARDAYSYVLANCPNPADRLATMQKALPALPEEMTVALLGQERAGEFSGIRDDLARRHIGKAAEEPSLSATPEEIARIEALAGAANAPDDATLLGFYALRHNDPAKATTWFKTSLSRNGGAKAAEGAVLALSAAKDHQQAEELGSQWLQADAANRKAYLDAATSLIAQDPPPRLDATVLGRIAKTVSAERYPSGASGLGWYAYNSGQIAAAKTWFETALAWDRGLEQAAYGLALTRQRLRDQAGLRELVAEWGPRSQRIADILRPASRRAVLTAAGDTGSCCRAVGNREPRALAAYEARNSYATGGGKASRAHRRPRSRSSRRAVATCACGRRNLRWRQYRLGCPGARVVPAQSQASGRCRRGV